MSNYGPASAFLLVGGKQITSSDVYDLEENVEQINEEHHGLGDSWELHKPIGVARVEITQGDGLYDDRLIGTLAAFQEKGQTKQLVSYGMAGYAEGANAVLLNGSYIMSWKRKAKKDGLTLAQPGHKITGTYLRGLVVNGLASKSGATGDTTAAPADAYGTLVQPEPIAVTSSNAGTDAVTTTTPHGLSTGDQVTFASHSGSTPNLNGGDGYLVVVTGANTFTLTDFAAAAIDITVGGTGGTVQRVSAAAGGYADLHVPALSLGGYTNVTVLLRHSYDGTTWATLATFTNFAVAGTSERTASLAYQRRYLSISWTFNGAGSGPTGTFYVACNRS